jgi:hypothetical protein
MAVGLLGFSNNKAHGKILPCHRVMEDELMRISCHNVHLTSTAKLFGNDISNGLVSSPTLGQELLQVIFRRHHMYDSHVHASDALC